MKGKLDKLDFIKVKNFCSVEDPVKKIGEGSRSGAWASLVAQWIRICLPMQGTQVQSLVQEDPTCHGATKPVRHNY